jgi:hypothetical protein
MAEDAGQEVNRIQAGGLAEYLTEKTEEYRGRKLQNIGYIFFLLTNQSTFNCFVMNKRTKNIGEKDGRI